MLEEDSKVLKYNHGEESMEVTFVSLKIRFPIKLKLKFPLKFRFTVFVCRNNPRKSSTTKISKHTPSGYSLFTCSSFDTKENKLDCYRAEDYIKEFCKDLKKHVTRIINYEKKKRIPLTNEERKTHRRQKECYICKKEFSIDDDDKKHHKVKDHCHYTGKYRGVAHNICNLRYKTLKEIPVVFYNYYHLIIKELPEEFEREFECLGKNTEKCITFSVPIKKGITKIDKNGNDKIMKDVIQNKVY